MGIIMPNWCRNNLTIESSDSKLIEKFKLALDSDGLFQTIKPNPTGEWSYAWSVENWGTKWDVRGDEVNVIQLDDDRIIVEFDTAWGPPISFYEYLEELGYEVSAMYNEEGMAFCGIYTEGNDETYEYGDMTSEEIKAFLPDELDDCFMISELMEEREENDW